MATVIDELVITLGLDPKGLTEGQKAALANFKRFRDEAEKTRKAAESEGQRAAEGFYGKIKSEALALFAVLIGANTIAQFVGKTVQGLTDVHNAAKATDLDAARLRAFGMVISAMGGDAKAAQQEMTDLAKVMQGWKSGQIMPGVDFLKGMSQIGGQRTDTPEQIFQRLSRYAQTHSAAQTGMVARWLGFNQDADTVEAMRGYERVLRDIGAAMERAPSDRDIDQVTELGIEWRILGQEIQHSGVELMGFLKVAEGLKGLAAFLHSWNAPGKGDTTTFDPVRDFNAGVNRRGPAPTTKNIGANSLQEAWDSWFGPRKKSAAPSRTSAPAVSGGDLGTLLGAVYQQESNSGRNAGYSRAGALGPFQLMPDTAKRFGVTDRTSYAQERVAAEKYLRWLLGHYGGDLDKALAGYNWGEGHVDRDIAAHGSAWLAYAPRETRDYIASIRRRIGGGETRLASVNINQITVNTRATDANGIAKSIGGALKSNLPTQAVSGLNG